ncbi:MAG: aryl-sulfate sulfotransferase [Edaphobacter sp.]|uniref:aryl-sulfate sulfotransferase n=1 Tax=Edaphobacter sp. TaxID=1934404 RepID=UPI0023A6576F|nr:aryl-sulfate sulfotransferase [Edaphobacter sp.]MDE1178576.1 aryl-sulfate sulfotransferase [Edaphobacter sp.]
MNDLISSRAGRTRSLSIGLLLSLALMACTSCSSGKVSVSTTAFDFGSTAVNTRVHRVVVTISNSTSLDVSTSPSVSGAIESAISRSGSCGSTVAAGSACSMVLTFAPSTAGSQTGALNLNLTGTHLPATQAVSLAGTGVVLDEGESLVVTTNNPLVALYSFHPTSPGDMWIDFGTTTSYGFSTNTHATPSGGGTVSIYVAGMRANTTYHMRASVKLADGSVITDTDHTFTTTNFPANTLPTLAVTTNGTPQPGVELVDVSLGKTSTYLQAYATDLSGNIIWGYNYPDRGADTIVQPVKLMPNGNVLVTVSYNSSDLVDGPPSGELVDVREIDLAGNPVRDITADQLNTRLASAGYNLTIYDIHHDVEVLPNGHWVLIANTIKNVSPYGNVVGDVIIDLDTNLQPVWLWNEFDHLDVSRQPTDFPDWTHTNAVLYSRDDGDLLISIRHQSWIIKVNYANGTGDGSIVWKLGEGGDFTLTNGTDPIDWFYGQHQPSFFSTATSGVFSLALMDNGYHREVSSNTYCGTNVDCYTTVPILSINESAKTATIVYRDTLPTSQYSSWGGGSTQLANGNLEFDLCSQDGYNSEVDEVKYSGGSIQTVWTMKSTGTNLYRANRIPSLYPGVQW